MAQSVKRVVGLKNLGNTCYLNSVLQSLASSSSLRLYLENGRSSHGKQPLTDALHETLEELNKDYAQAHSVEPPRSLLKVPPLSALLNTKEQQDAHELMQLIMNMLDDEHSPHMSSGLKSLSIRHTARPLPTKSASQSFLRTHPLSVPKQNPPTFVNRAKGDVELVKMNSFQDNPFYGLMATTKKCASCGSESLPHYQKFFGLSLSIPENQCADEECTLYKCLDQFTTQMVEDVEWEHQRTEDASHSPPSPTHSRTPPHPSLVAGDATCEPVYLPSSLSSLPFDHRQNSNLYDSLSSSPPKSKSITFSTHTSAHRFPLPMTSSPPKSSAPMSFSPPKLPSCSSLTIKSSTTALPSVHALSIPKHQTTIPMQPATITSTSPFVSLIASLPAPLPIPTVVPTQVILPTPGSLPTFPPTPATISKAITIPSPIPTTAPTPVTTASNPIPIPTKTHTHSTTRTKQTSPLDTTGTCASGRCTALLSSTIARPPLSLCLHLRRLVVVSRVHPTFIKLDTHIQFPIMLDLASYCGLGIDISSGLSTKPHGPIRKLEYKLVAVIVHSGGACGGHFTVFRRLSSPDARPLWANISDDYLTFVDEQKVLESEAYMLYYEREHEQGEVPIDNIGLLANLKTQITSGLCFTLQQKLNGHPSTTSS